jgi:hypothetical protein
VVVDVVTDNAASDLVWRGTTSGEPLAVAGTPGPYVPSMTREQHSAQLMRDAPDVGGRPDLALAHFLEQISDDESVVLRKVLRRSGVRKSAR